MGVGDVEVLSFWDILEPETGGAFQTRKSHFLHFLLFSDAWRTDGKERRAGRRQDTKHLLSFPYTPSSATGNVGQWPFNHLEISPRRQKPQVLIFGFYSEIPLDRFCGIDGLKFARIIMLDLQLSNFAIIGFILTKAP